MRKQRLGAFAVLAILVAFSGCHQDRSATPSSPAPAPVVASRKHHRVKLDTIAGMKHSAAARDVVDWYLKDGDTSPFMICFVQKSPCVHPGPIIGSGGTASCTVADPPIAGKYKYDVGNNSCPKRIGKLKRGHFSVTPCRGCGELDLTDSDQ